MPLMETALMSLLINIRYSVYGLSLIEPFRKCGLRRFYMIGALTDETYALLVQDERPSDVKREDFMFLVALFNGVLLNKELEYVKVPALVGEVYSDYLAQELSDFNIQLRPQQYDDTHAKGVIMSQEPAGGTEVKKGADIWITISMGSP